MPNLNPAELMGQLANIGGSLVVEPPTPAHPIPVLVIRLPMTPDTLSLMSNLAGGGGSPNGVAETPAGV